MAHIFLTLETKLTEMYSNAPFIIRATLLASIGDPEIEQVGPARPALVEYPLTSAGSAQRILDQDLSAIADCFEAATRAMKQTIYGFAPLHIQDLLQVDNSLTTQTVLGMLLVLQEQFGDISPAQQLALINELQVPFNPRSQTMPEFLSSFRHTRMTLTLIGLTYTDVMFAELLCKAIIAGDPTYSIALDHYLMQSDERDLPTLYRIISNRSAVLARANAAHALSVVPTEAANALVPAAATQAGRPKRQNQRHRRGGAQNRSADRRPTSTLSEERPNIQDIGALAAQLQHHFRIQAHAQQRPPRPAGRGYPLHRPPHPSAYSATMYPPDAWDPLEWSDEFV